MFSWKTDKRVNIGYCFFTNTVKLGYNELGYNEHGYNEQKVQSQMNILLHKSTRL